MDNMLLQVVGRKRCVLFAPSDVRCLHMRGDKSAVVDIDLPLSESTRTRFPEFARAKRYECTLLPGDILFIPGYYLPILTSSLPSLSKV